MLTSERPIKDAVQQEPATGNAERPRGDNELDSPSADFAALINAIAREGAANRSEEKREDSGKKFRDWITIILLIATTGGIYWQIHEMIKVYGPISDQGRSLRQQVSDFEIANRAFVVVGGLGQNITRDQQGTIQSMSFTPIIVNSGNTPTKDLEFVVIDPYSDAVIRGGADQHPIGPLPPDIGPLDPERFFDDGMDELQKIIIGPQKYILGPKVALPAITPPFEITAEKFQLVRNRTYGHYYYGAIRYHDSFDGTKTHITKYCFNINNSQMNPAGVTTGMLPFYTICKHWNCADEECDKDKLAYDEDAKADTFRRQPPQPPQN